MSAWGNILSVAIGHERTLQYQKIRYEFKQSLTLSGQFWYFDGAWDTSGATKLRPWGWMSL